MTHCVMGLCLVPGHQISLKHSAGTHGPTVRRINLLHGWGGDSLDVGKLREWFRQGVEHRKKWHGLAKEDYEFYHGQQWAPTDIAALKEQQRPAITINKIKPLIQLLEGWQRLNRYEPDFLPRTADDLELCKIRKGVTKFVMDRNDYDYEESRVFKDGIICGKGWLSAEYEWNYEKLDGDIKVKRISPMDMYVDPESKEPDLSDAEYICRAKWVTKDKIKDVYPEHEEAIETFVQTYDKDEQLKDKDLWYSKEKKKCRLVEVWYKEHYAKTIYIMPDGTVIPAEQMPEGVQMPEDIRQVRLPLSRIKFATLLGEVVLEEGDSPYKHGYFPFVPFTADYTGEVETEDDCQGIIRALKDPQREVNKRRSQSLHIINTTANPIYWVRDGSMQPADFQRFKDRGAVAGGVFRYSMERPEKEQAASFPMQLAQAEEVSTNDLRAISGINPEMLGESMPAGTSGKAIELRQRQSVTQIASLFDNLRMSKKLLLSILWGETGKPGLIPQYYKEEKVIRITGDNGKQQFMPINQPEQDPFGMPTGRVLNDLSIGEFDIVISDTPATPTMRYAQFQQLLEAVQSGVQIPPDIILDASDLPQKEELKQRMLEQQQQQMQMQQEQQQQQMQLQAAKAGLMPGQGVDVQGIQPAL